MSAGPEKASWQRVRGGAFPERNADRTTGMTEGADVRVRAAGEAGNRQLAIRCSAAERHLPPMPIPRSNAGPRAELISPDSQVQP